MSQPNYHTTKFFSTNLLAIEMKKQQKLMNKPILNQNQNKPNKPKPKSTYAY